MLYEKKILCRPFQEINSISTSKPTG